MAPEAWAESAAEDPLTDVVASVRSLAALLPEGKDIKSQHVLRIVDALSAREREAVKSFWRAGQRCLAKLTGSTLLALKRILSGQRAVARGRSDAYETEDNAVSSAYELFERFDIDKDGVLSNDEFEKACRTLLGDGMSNDQIAALMNAADVNRTGDIDIHEFTIWLYGQVAEPESAPPLRRAETAPVKHVEKTDKETWKEEISSLQTTINELRAELNAKSSLLKSIEKKHEEEVEASLNFWRDIAKNAVLTIDHKIDLENSEWLGNGKFGFVLKAVRKRDKKDVVVKMMGLRWAHVAVREWQQGNTFGTHPNIVEYEEVMLHNDDSDMIEKLLLKGYESGRLHSKQKRNCFPDRFLCLVQEFMNQGTVQDWMNEGQLAASGIILVMQKVASALRHMHKNKVTHNDIKPENVMLQLQPDATEITVKLGDLGCSLSSSETAADLWQYGMTTFCMITGEKFGARKYRAELAGEICEELRPKCERLSESLTEVPELLRRLFARSTCMADVAALEWLEGGSLRPAPRRRSSILRKATTSLACRHIGEELD
eukprot:TRINITY_DN8793_c0_g1_i1.p1 TRINITY_DN8793_c0_g1~~TRINITY_DN8793_c0_g1_i1.p1  ORF type:complete len:594 (+),score=95.50 TRINITY_DN8793_c0_g1_i1:145-1782(+)